MAVLKRITGFVLGGLCLIGASTASAAVIGFDDLSGTGVYETGDFVFSNAKGTNGNCPGGVGPCLHYSNPQSTTLERIDGGTFSLESLAFRFQGNGTGNLLTVFDTNNITNKFDFGPLNGYVKNTDYQVAFGSSFANVLSITIATFAGGNVRIDDLGLRDDVGTTTPVPVPAAGIVLLTGLGALGMVRRRRKTT
ncbi:VPLPA-CTERM sorting domain-containing protein [Qingshengfaniella alkalisoli]|nr:VPLPA-CTERM sorting domain-containing protein [Qingshengfaniella alkalisoli]